ncbi:hypothetical protein [Pseudohongiella spirulinae]|uniref:Uncharacterized protein n=1 Tax=Pseudohongiella spirulinae TaxID=1249552 RepID=A0A0S2KFQ4_9GAMM|nr:hypothetical protein [Pseudohongiella spirulinae]ALO46868.1 hypothetical protein PS2015_2233 [Pseudohongiella spirulinae]
MNSRKIVFISAVIGILSTPLLAVAQHDQHTSHNHMAQHAQQISTVTAWLASTSEIPDGLILTVTAIEPADTVKIRGLGFAGFMVQGNHHQPHHLMMATSAFGHHH